MNIAVIGLGSMGKRRIRLLREMYPDYRIFGVDGREDRRAEAADQFDIFCYDKLGSIETDLNCAFVCTSPLSHAVLIKEALEKGLNVFTELNLISDGYDENISLAKKKDLILFLSSTFIYREEIGYIRKKVTGGKWNYIYHIGQYLPDWHPWEKYQDFFLGNRKTNGCREILAIELPWITGTFGDVETLNSIGDNISDLDIEYKDNFMIQLTHKNGNKGVLVVDVVSPVAVRKLEVYRENNYISWDGTPESLMEFDINDKELKQVPLSEKTEHVGGYRSFIVENAYKNEIMAFFNEVTYRKKPLYDFKQDKRILELIDSIGA